MTPLSFFPLGPTRTIPVTKHVRTNSHNVVPVKRSRPSTLSTPSSPNAKKRALTIDKLTPAPSSDGPAPGMVAFKVPAVPALPTHMASAPPTPSTSTIAASSSPRHRHPATSPTRRPPAMKVRLVDGETLVFGRHHVRNRPAVSAPPPAIVEKLTYPTNPARTIVLDRGASHASRVHAAAELLPTTPPQIRLVVVGQNGLRIRIPGGKYRRISAGNVRTFPAAAFEIEFYGAAVSLSLEDPDETDEELFTPPMLPVEPVVQTAPSPLSLPPSSPPRPAMSSPAPYLGDLDDEMDVEVPTPAPTPLMSRIEPTPKESPQSERSSSPLSDIDDEPTPIQPTPIPAMTPAPAAIAVKQEMLDDKPVTVIPLKRAHTPKSRAPTPPSPAPAPEGLDMPALLASTVVFSGSSKLSLPDLVKSLLESQPNMRVHGDEAAWGVWAAAELAVNPMFGKITRNGRDSSGKPLEPHYYYNPANDPDPARASQLAGLVRPLRATQRGGGRAIDWRPVGPGRRR
ncbi:hypothetical protein CcaverHIS631_0202900 [Cutaneotrichosporon cavernicola]|nr:hypothetical protein CcaverHIS631_0202900 [Cutaneotrichosporon cavernicola]